MKKVILLDTDRPMKGQYQFFLDWFKDAWINNGGEIKKKIELPRLARSFISRTRVSRSTVFTSKHTAILTVGGADVDFAAFPYTFFYEVIPILWDTWPRYNRRLVSGLKRNEIKNAFFTQSQVAMAIKQNIPTINTFWLPEAINAEGYKKGNSLKERGVDILQYGRRLEKYHKVILNTIDSHKYIFSENLVQKVFRNQRELVEGLSNSKICLSFPRSDTHPEMAGDIETLTQRYWEGMLSRCLVVGRAPKELVDIMGYNPVVEIDWSDPENQLKGILNNIEEYQELVDNNYNKAISVCSWDGRVLQLMNKLEDLGYQI